MRMTGIQTAEPPFDVFPGALAENGSEVKQSGHKSTDVMSALQVVVFFAIQQPQSCFIFYLFIFKISVKKNMI